MKKIKLVLTCLLIICYSCNSNDDSDQLEGSTDSNEIRLEIELQDGADDVIISYKVNNFINFSFIEILSEENISSNTTWSKTLIVNEDFNNIQLTAANTSAKGLVFAKVYVGDKLVGSNSSGSIAIVLATIQ
jgi:hypothetical protein